MNNAAASERDAVIRRWARKADADLRNAEHTLTLGEDCPLDTVGFHAQQCAEKYLKALLVAYDLPVPRIHDVRKLAQLLSASDALPTEIDTLALNDLTAYAVDSRYPDDDEEPLDRMTVEAAVLVAKQVRTAVRAVVLVHTALTEVNSHQPRLL